MSYFFFAGRKIVQPAYPRILEYSCTMRQNELNKKISMISVILIPLIVIFAAVDSLFLHREDVSRAQVEHRHVFGATYMTMNNPYYKVVDTQLRAILEQNGDVLLTRDGTMNQERQNEEIRELIKSGAEAIFIACVDWDEVEDGIRYARSAGVPVIAIDTEVRNSKLVTVLLFQTIIRPVFSVPNTFWKIVRMRILSCWNTLRRSPDGSGSEALRKHWRDIPALRL